MYYFFLQAVVSLLFTSLLVRCQVHQSEKCDRYSPEEAYYGIIRPAAVGVIEGKCLLVFSSSLDYGFCF